MRLPGNHRAKDNAYTLKQDRFNFIKRAIPQIPPRNRAKTNFRVPSHVFIANPTELAIRHSFLYMDKNVLSLLHADFHRKSSVRY